MSFIDFGLGLAGLDEKTIADVDRAWPGMARLADLARIAEPDLTAAKPHLDALEPLLRQALPHLQALQPIAARLWPIAQRAWPDIVAVTPTVDELLNFVKAKQAQG